MAQQECAQQPKHAPQHAPRASQAPRLARAPRTSEPAPPIEETALDDFTDAQRERLQRLRRAIARGERSDRFPVDKRQDFIRWLVDHGKLSEN
jgi:hypothetical protein